MCGQTGNKTVAAGKRQTAEGAGFVFSVCIIFLTRNTQSANRQVDKHRWTIEKIVE